MVICSPWDGRRQKDLILYASSRNANSPKDGIDGGAAERHFDPWLKSCGEVLRKPSVDWRVAGVEFGSLLQGLGILWRGSQGVAPGWFRSPRWG